MKPAQYIRTCTLMLTDNFYYFCNKCQISFQGAGKKIPCLFSPFASHALIPGEKRQEEGGGREGGKAQNKGKGEEKSAHCTLVAQEERHGVLRERKLDAAAAKGDFTYIWSGEEGGEGGSECIVLCSRKLFCRGGPAGAGDRKDLFAEKKFRLEKRKKVNFAGNKQKEIRRLMKSRIFHKVTNNMGTYE